MGRNGMKTLLLLLFFLMARGTMEGAAAGTIQPGLERMLSLSSDTAMVPVIITLSEKADLEAIAEKERRLRRSRVIRTLREKAESSQKEMHDFLRKRKAEGVHSLWIKNALTATVPVSVIRELKNHPGVQSIEEDRVIHAPEVRTASAASAEWNIDAIHARELWSYGITGQGVVVANMDTGVDGEHPDLKGRWRGGTNSWYDPNGEHDAPFDAQGHGTQTMGILVGGGSGGTSIGVAPGAAWIAVKIFDDRGESRSSTIHRGFQWLLDPDGDPDTDDAPDIVSNSWGIEGFDTCNEEYLPAIQALQAAWIAVVFSAGNDGPSPATSVSPANYSGVLSAGSVDSSLSIGFSSSRGPSACTNGDYPTVVAPGAGITTSDLSFGGLPLYAFVDGTSYAAPHVAGAMALLKSAFPGVSVLRIEDALKRSAQDRGAAGSDYDYGYGLVNIARAYARLRGDSMGVFRKGKWHFDSDGNGEPEECSAERECADFSVGEGEVPVTGDWDGDGTTDIGVFKNGLWLLDSNGNRKRDRAPSDSVFFYGRAGDIPVTGDWDGSGRTKVGIFREGKWYLDMNGNGAFEGCTTDKCASFGEAGDVPVTGDWDGDGRTKIGVFREGEWYVDGNGNGIEEGCTADKCTTFGRKGDLPVTGDWDGGGWVKIGVFRAGTWILDSDDDGKLQRDTDKKVSFGSPLHRPVTGKW